MWPGLKMLGVTEVAVRLPSLIAAICCALMIFSFGRRLGLRDGSAALAAAVWLSCLQVMIHAIGDEANLRILDIYRQAAEKNGPRDRRFRIEHTQHKQSVLTKSQKHQSTVDVLNWKCRDSWMNISNTNVKLHC